MRRPDAPPKEALSTAAASAIDGAREELVGIALDIHAHPELNYQEHYSADLLAGTLEQHGFAVERGAGGLETAFRASPKAAPVRVRPWQS